MATFKCKMCGGDLTIQEGLSVAQCNYCGTQQTLPKTRDENVANLFNVANAQRAAGEFDKAEETYQKIIELDFTEAEAHWGAVLSRYGIEYVEDPATHKRTPTCHRASYDAVAADMDFRAALQHGDTLQQAMYQQEARLIDDIQRRILAVSQNEPPFDVFICYKETDPTTGERTEDSVTTNEIYYYLTNAGYKVFYAPITLEDKLGTEYEPYIFAALNSAKVMLVVGSKKDYFEAPWVKNEWSRFLKIIKKDPRKKLFPCYKNMNAYDLPAEFAHLQAQDMSRIGFIADIIQGVKKILSLFEIPEKPIPAPIPAPRLAPRPAPRFEPIPVPMSAPRPAPRFEPIPEPESEPQLTPQEEIMELEKQRKILEKNRDKKIVETKKITRIVAGVIWGVMLLSLMAGIGSEDFIYGLVGILICCVGWTIILRVIRKTVCKKTMQRYQDELNDIDEELAELKEDFVN